MKISVKLDLPQEVLEAYEKEGPVERVLADRLVASVAHTSKHPLYISDYQRSRLEKMFARNFSSVDEFVKTVERALSVRIEGMPINLSPTLLTRLRSRCFGKPFEKFLEEETVRGLEEFAGMR